MAKVKKQSTGKYVDGFVLVVPKAKVEEYKKMAKGAAKMWMKFGALDYKECMIEDAKPNMGGMKHLLFPDMIKAKSNETVWFSYIVYKSRKHRDQVNAKVMKAMDKEMEQYKNKPMPFDMERFSYGGFSVIVQG